MFLIALFLGIYSNIILVLGFSGLLYKNLIAVLTALFFISIFYYYRRELKESIQSFKDFFSSLSNFERFIALLIAALFLVNLFGVLSPETAFDPLWYHLTLPKIFLENHSIFYIPGGLLYYSTMPKLIETLYMGILSFWNETGAHFLSLIFGVLSLMATYKVSRLYFDRKISLIASLIFYSNIVVAWESTTSFIDIGRMFFEVLAFYAFILWAKKKETKYIYLSAVFLGLQISSKIIGIADLTIFSVLIFYASKNIKLIGKYILTALFIPLPWLVFSFMNTGNPLYPIFSKVYPSHLSTELLSPSLLLNPINFIHDSFSVLTTAQDPISPIYLIAIPLIVLILKKLKRDEKYLVIYSSIAFLVWYLTPKTGGGRFIMTYLPVFSIVAVLPLIYLKDKMIKNILLPIIILIAMSTISYRFLAQVKYIPVVLGNQSKSGYLYSHLNYSFGDFYDTDGYFKNNLKSSDMVLLYGFHNLYYVDFNFIDSSWVKKGDSFNFIATQNAILPERFSFWKLIYYNPKTHVSLYSLNGQKWVY